ncbi:TetR family transcriptional regulator [Georgenia sunbinii]|uniref:TetR family transcriptional regulator n=1 Tax=Georgenia sunbinii TaxID=3117728 RepID=UPI002F268A00
MRSADDLHAKARIRNAAVARFGADGFDAGLRTVAADAGVSPALVLHHFGSKAGLREACDTYVLQVIHEGKVDVVGPGGPEHMLAQLAATEEYAPVAAYAVASLAAGGHLAHALVEQITASTIEYLELGVAAGTIRPSADAAARARYLALSALGLMLTTYRLRAEEARPVDITALFDEVTTLTVAPALELFTQGLFTDSRFLDTYRASPTGGDHS